jgi:hypothetical protein
MTPPMILFAIAERNCARFRAKVGFSGRSNSVRGLRYRSVDWDAGGVVLLSTCNHDARQATKRWSVTSLGFNEKRNKQVQNALRLIPWAILCPTLCALSRAVTVLIQLHLMPHVPTWPRGNPIYIFWGTLSFLLRALHWARISCDEAGI